MKTRLIWMAFGLAFCVALAVVVGQRLSAEAMAVVVGVFTGVAASIPTSLIVFWLAARVLGDWSEPPLRPAPEPRPAEPHIVVVAPPLAAAHAAYGAAPMALVPQTAGPRRFTVIGGAEAAYDEAVLSEEELWQR
jgi:hypothetical protein